MGHIRNQHALMSQAGMHEEREQTHAWHTNTQKLARHIGRINFVFGRGFFA